MRKKMKIFKKCIPSACESVYREIFVPDRETMRLSSKPWDLRGLLLDGGSPMLWQIYVLYCHENSVQKYKNKEQKIQWEIKQSHA